VRDAPQQTCFLRTQTGGTPRHHQPGTRWVLQRHDRSRAHSQPRDLQLTLKARRKSGKLRGGRRPLRIPHRRQQLLVLHYRGNLRSECLRCALHRGPRGSHLGPSDGHHRQKLGQLLGGPHRHRH